MAAETDLQFDGWTVNRVTGEIARDGRSARLAQQPLRILLELYDHAGEVVTREQLVKALWPAGVVDFDNGLNVAVRKLRVALDDVGEVPRYIETLPRVGYRFVGERELRVAAATPSRTARRRTWLIVALVALPVVAALGWWLRATPLAAHHVPSVRARELYLEGLSQRSRRDIDSFAIAQEKFQAALREDPDYAQAWATLGDSLSAAVIRQKITPADGVPRARQAAGRALALDPGVVEGHYLMAQIDAQYDKKFAAAGIEFERALRIDDHSARLWHHYALWQGQLGHVDDALASMRRAREIEPMTLLYSVQYGMLLYYARRYPEAVAFLTPLVEANPKFDEARSVLGVALSATGDLAGALAQLQARGNAEAYQADLGTVLARLGQREGALREIDRLEARRRKGYGVAYDEALIYTALDDLDKGCELLMRALQDQSVMVNWMRLEPRLDPLRGRQCYADAEKRLYAAG